MSTRKSVLTPPLVKPWLSTASSVGCLSSRSLPWYCLGCGRRLGSPVCKKWCVERYGSIGAERVPPLDLLIELIPVGYNLTDHQEEEARAAWFESKRRKEATRMAAKQTTQ